MLMVPVYSLPPESSSLSFFVVGVRPRSLFGSTARYEERRRMSADDRAKATVVEPRPPRCALGLGNARHYLADALRSCSDGKS